MLVFICFVTIFIFVTFVAEKLYKLSTSYDSVNSLLALDEKSLKLLQAQNDELKRLLEKKQDQLERLTKEVKKDKELRSESECLRR